MKKNYRIKVTLTGLRTGRLFFHHEPDKVPCAEFYFSPLYNREKLEREPVILRCVAYGDAALILLEQGHRFLRLTGRIISNVGNPSNQWVEKDYLLVEEVKFGKAAINVQPFNYASCHGVCHPQSMQYADGFTLRGVDRNGDPGGMFCLMDRKLTKEEKKIVFTGGEFTVIGSLKSQVPVDEDASVSEQMKAGSCFMILVKRIILPKQEKKTRDQRRTK